MMSEELQLCVSLYIVQAYFTTNIPFAFVIFDFLFPELIKYFTFFRRKQEMTKQYFSQQVDYIKYEIKKNQVESWWVEAPVAFY